MENFGALNAIVEAANDKANDKLARAIEADMNKNPLDEHIMRALRADERYKLKPAEAPSTKNLISRSRASLANMISTATAQRASLQRDIATAKAVHDAAVAKAKADLDAATADIRADLHQVSETLGTLQLAHDRLAESEV